MNFVKPIRISIDTYPTFLRQACEPIRAWLEDPLVIEIMANEPGAVWVEKLGEGLRRFVVNDLTAERIQRIAHNVAGNTDQAVNRITPALSAAMPNGERFQALLSPAAPSGGAFSIRKQVINDLSLESYRDRGAFDGVKILGPRKGGALLRDELDDELCAILKSGGLGSIDQFFSRAVAGRKTILISGGTSSGKTTFLNALLKQVPYDERVVSIEDTRELRPPQPNYVAMLASKGGQGLAKVTINDLLQVTLRMRPDRIFLGEIRGTEAFDFLQAVNTGHPGSLSTVHADTAELAYARLAMMVMQAGLGLSMQETSDYIKTVVPIVVQLKSKPRRGISHIYYGCWRD